jgi:hypothetical protein
MIPSATQNLESCVIHAPVDKVWAAIRSMDFSSWWGNVTASSCEDASPQALGSTHKLSFKDGTVWTIVVCELSDLSKTLSFELITSDPDAAISAAIHTIRVQKVTKDNTTFLTFESQFSADSATAEAVADSKYKKLELFDDLINKFD